MKWYRHAAEQGVASPEGTEVSRMSAGEGVPQDWAEAVKWYRRAADAGRCQCPYNLGITYANGKGVPQDYAEA